MVTTLKPDTPDQLLETIRWAAAETSPIEVIGCGSKRSVGRPSQVDATLDLSALAGIGLYEPNELVLAAAAATPLADIHAALTRENQIMAFEPPDWGPLLGGQPAQQTVGGVVATNLSGPRRIKAGALRDHFLGAKAVSGRGEAFKSGGRVVKNVTGYDLCKLLAGSYGTLAVMSEVTLKVLPAPEKTRTALVFGLTDGQASAAMTAALTSAHEVSGAAHLPAAIAARSDVSYVSGAGAAVTAVRVEGPSVSVAHRCAALRELLGAFGDTEELHGHNSKMLWAEIGNVSPFVDTPDRIVWRVSTPPSDGHAVASRIAASIPDGEVFYDWGGGLLWLSLPAAADGGAAAVRQALGERGGHATLIRATADLRAAVDVFEPQASGLAALTRRLKAQFDPNGILNPGRMYAGV